MVVFPNAKINLGLFVTEKRSDGFHNIETVFVPVKGFRDVLEVIDNKTDESDHFSTSGINVVKNQEDNLVIKALRLLRENHPIPPLKIHLHKNIPAGAGLGGGSADAAFMLKLLNEQYELNLPPEELEEKAALLGADCAFFIRNYPLVARGKGNVFSDIELSLSGNWIMLVIPPVSLSTPEAYRNIVPKHPEENIENILKAPITTWHKNLINDFEKNAFAKYPELQQIKNTLYNHGAIYASMSGSGSAIYGIFRHKPQISWPDKYTIWCGKL